MINVTKIFPTVLIIMSISSSVVYAFHGFAENWRMVVYWLAAALLTAMVTY